MMIQHAELVQIHITIKAVVYADRKNLNYQLIKQGLVTEKEDDSPAGIHARYTPGEIREGSVWEYLLHRDTMIHTKFAQIRSPMEDYWRREVYGKNWQTWEHPWRDYIVPTYESFSMKNPIVSAAIGAFFGSRFGADAMGRRVGAVVGGTIMGLGSIKRVATEAVTGERWIPERRRKERDVEEYLMYLSS